MYYHFQTFSARLLLCSDTPIVGNELFKLLPQLTPPDQGEALRVVPISYIVNDHG
jgi:hypothetical protein